MKYPVLKSVLMVCLALLLAHCASVQNDVCPAGEQLAASGDTCERIECNGGEVEGDLCVCPAEQVLDEVTCRDANDPCIGLGCNDGNGCTADNCTQGACSFDAVPDGDACSFGDSSGVCLAGVCDDDPCSSIDCDDGNQCTIDATCNPSNARCEGVRDTADGTACDFGELPGTCVSGRCEDAMLCAGMGCDDDNPCTENDCDRLTGDCLNTGLAELTPCELEGVLGECMSEVCVGLCEDAATRCDDNSACTTDSCNPDTGCVNTDACGDSNPCTEDVCLSPSTGACGHNSRPNGTRCTITFPNLLIGECQDGVCRSIIINPPILP